MYGIYLSKRDKKILRAINDSGMDTDILKEENYLATIEYLKRIGLIETQNSCGEFRVAKLSEFGKKFKMENPKLKSEIPEQTKWIITTILSVTALVVSIIANLRI